MKWRVLLVAVALFGACAARAEPREMVAAAHPLAVDAGLTALRFDNWKLIFAEQRADGTLRVWSEPFTELRVPLMFNLRTDPYERAQITSNTYYDWCLDHAFLLVPAQAYVGKFLMTFKEFPPSQTPASFTLDQVMKNLQESGGSK